MMIKRAFSKKSKLPPLGDGPKFDMKYFITRATILSVYRESLKLCYQIKSDDQMRDSMVEMMKQEFRPFIDARE